MTTRFLEVIECTEAEMAAYRASGQKTLIGRAWLVLSPTGGITELVLGSGLAFADSPSLTPSPSVTDVVRADDTGAIGDGITADTLITLNIGGTQYLIEAEEVVPD